MENNLPKGWEEVELSFLVDYKKGKKPKRMESKPFNDPLVYLDIRAIEKKNDEIFVDAETSNATHEDELVIVWDGARAGWVGKSRKGALGSTLMGLKPKIDRDYLYRFIQTQFDHIQTNHRGTGIPHVDPDIFWNIKVPVAPENEQQRIIAKLDELMEKIDRSRARLERIPKILKRFRQSILSAAVTGTLTKKWRNSNSPNESALDYINRIRASGNPIDLTSEGIPDTWINVQFGQVFEIVRGSSPRPKGDPRYFSNKKTAYHWIMLSDFTDNTKNNVLTTTNEYLTEDGSKYGRYVNQNDILVGVSGVYGVGRTCLLDIEGYIYDGIMAIKRVNDASLRSFFNYFMQLQRLKLMDVATGTSWPNINTDILKKYICPIPPPNEQAEIIRHVELLLTVADKIEARYEKAREHLDRLPQSLLAKAFRGDLVAQDENDEPARALLERINDKASLRLVKKTRTKEYQIEPLASISIAAEAKTKYAESVRVNIPENKRAFAKQVLGGKIVSLFNDDPHFTHIKFQKLQYLAEHLAEVDLNWNYYRQSAGPYDPKFMHTVAFKLKTSKWFEEKKYKFYPLEKVDKIEDYYNGYFKPVDSKLTILFTALKNSTEDDAEVIATLYAVWNNMIIKKESISDTVIVSTFFEWSDRKKKYTQQQVSKALAWMKKSGFMPTGFGRVIKEKKNRILITKL